MTSDAHLLVQRALRGRWSRWKHAIATRKADFLLALGLSSGLLFLCQIALAFAFMQTIAAIEAPAQRPLHLPLQRSITNAQAQLFLSALLQLPDIVDVAYITKE